MRFTNRRLDRVWLWIVAIGFALAIPLWIAIMVERMGWPIVALAVAICGGLMYRRITTLPEASASPSLSDVSPCPPGPATAPNRRD